MKDVALRQALCAFGSDTISCLSTSHAFSVLCSSADQLTAVMHTDTQSPTRLHRRPGADEQTGSWVGGGPWASTIEGGVGPNQLGYWRREVCPRFVKGREVSRADLTLKKKLLLTQPCFERQNKRERDGLDEVRSTETSSTGSKHAAGCSLNFLFSTLTLISCQICSCFS